MKATRKGSGVRGRAIGAAVGALAMLCLTAGNAQAISWIFELDQLENGSMGSEAEATNPSSPVDYPPSFLNPTPTEFTLTIPGRATVNDLQDGDTITLGGFFLPPNLCFGDSLFPTCPNFSVPATLIGEIVETSAGSGRFDVTFDDIRVSHSGTSGGSQPVSGSFPLRISTLTTTLFDDSIGPTLFDGAPISYGAGNEATYTVVQIIDGVPTPVTTVGSDCTDGPTSPTGLDAPLVGLLDGTDFSNNSVLTLGGGTCGTGLNSAYLNSAEQPFLLGLTGTLIAPEPGTLLLVTSGLLGLAAVGRRRPLA